MLAVIVLAHDETVSLEQSLHSVKFADEILVITDRPSPATASVAEGPKVKVINHPLNGDFSAQRNFAMSQTQADWVLFVDADEVVSSRLAQEIPAATSQNSFAGYFLPRTDILWNHKFKYGDLAQVKILRLVKNHTGVWTGKVHETWQTSRPTDLLAGDLLHYPHPDLVQFLDSLNNYSTIRATELFSQGKKSSVWQITCYPLGKFTYLWIFKLGFLDGLPGLVHALLMAFYSFLVRGKLYLLSEGIT